MSTKLQAVTRRQVLAGSAVGATALVSGFPAPVVASSDPIKIGYLPALTGPSSSTGVGINRGTELAVKEINAAGGVDDSGVGREFGSESFDDHFNTKSVMVATHDAPFDWYRDTAGQRRLN